MKVDMPVRKKARIEMLPLIDIVFLLLVFFIYAMLSMAVHRGLRVELPLSASAVIDQQALLSVTVRDSGEIYVDEAPTTLEELPELLQRMAESRDDPEVLLFGERQLSYQQLFNVLDKIRASGISRISLQAETVQGQ
jgi:biopolymer transport protein ExbD